MATELPPTNGIHWRLLALENQVRDLEAAKPEVVAERVQNLIREVADLQDEMKSLRRAFWGFATSVAGGAVLFAFTVFQVWG